MRRPTLIGDLAAAFILGLAAYYAVLEIRPAPDVLAGVLIAFPGLLFFGALAAGASLIGHGWPTRAGRSLHCAGCGHAVAPETTRVLPYCQECGQAWRSFGGRVRGQAVTRHHRLLAGIVVVALALGGMWARSFATRQLLAQAPDWLLIRQVGVLSWGDLQDDWNELVSRALSPQSDRQLLQTLLNRRSRDGSLPSQLAVYLQSRANAGTLPPDVATRWVDELFGAQLYVPASVAAGDRITIELTSTFTAGWTSVADVPQVLLAGVSVDGQQVARSAWDRAAPTTIYGSGGTIFSHAVRTQKPGTVEIKVRGWFFIGQPDVDLAYDAAGMPKLPINSYARPFEFTRSVEVREAETPPAAPSSQPGPPTGPQAALVRHPLSASHSLAQGVS